ncbi:hypothetical protein CRUP_031246 [Coryphaenoides rupestris]|nr:hypothetical protein CRUP_031246 [Coryphaenoides rupestris]
MAVTGATRRFSDFLSSVKRSRPRPPVPASQVPILFREPYILSGYRPAGQAWRCYALSVFQQHNESLNVWTHLLAAGALLLRWGVAGAAGPWDLGALPMGLFAASALTYLALSVAAHLLQSRSELAHYSMFFLDYAGVAVYQYGSALGHYFYTAAPAWRAGPWGPAYLPAAALLAWLSCATCCFAKSYFRRPYPPARRICTLIPSGLTYLLIMSPVVHRLTAAWGPSTAWGLTAAWGPSTAETEGGLRLHASHMVLFLLSVIFFSCPVPERFLSPGRCDFLGQGHQIFHVLLALCSLCQGEALLGEYARWRREAGVGAGAGPLLLWGEFGAEQIWWACALHPVVGGCGLLTAALASRHKRRQLERERSEK